MKMTKQSLLGLGLMFGGAVMVFALAKQPAKTPETARTLEATEEIARPVAEPLTADMETEARILAQKQKEREAKVQESERQAKALLAAQEAARAEALRKAAASESQSQNLVVETRPEAEELARKQAEARERERAAAAKRQEQERARAAAEKAARTASSHTVQAGDNLIRLSRQYNVPVSAIAAANNMGRNDSLQKGRVLKIPSQREIAELEAKAREQERKAAEESAKAQRQQALNDKLAEARREARRLGINDGYGVQVSLAANQENADELAAKLKAAGYRVSTSQTNRGVRVVVGPERSREAAILLKEKINSDPKVGASGAWVTQMQ